MVKHLNERGEDWVKDNHLLIQKKPISTGVNRLPLK